MGQSSKQRIRIPNEKPDAMTPDWGEDEDEVIDCDQQVYRQVDCSDSVDENLCYHTRTHPRFPQTAEEHQEKATHF